MLKKLRCLGILALGRGCIGNHRSPARAWAAGPKNVIFVIGDGLANAQRRAARRDS